MPIEILSETPASSTYLQNALSGVDFSQVLTEIVSVAPTILPIVVTCMAFRKGLSWVLRLFRRA